MSLEIPNHTSCELVDIESLKPNPDNRNIHSGEQIVRLVKILKYQGWRYPIKVSNQSGFISSGEGRLIAAVEMGLTHVPVSYQDYSDEDQERADMVSDNAIAAWSELDFSGINSDIEKFDPSFDIDLYGINGFTIDPAESMAELYSKQEYENFADHITGENKIIKIVFASEEYEKLLPDIEKAMRFLGCDNFKDLLIKSVIRALDSE